MSLPLSPSASPAPGVHTLCELLRHRATLQPDDLAYLFLGDGETHETRLTYAELDRAARRIARGLRGLARPGERALLVFPHGPDYVEAFFGCLYAGVIAMPAYPPSPARPERAMRRLQGMVETATPTLALGPPDVLDALRAAAGSDPAWARVCFVSEFACDAAADSASPEVGPATVAFLQYTSGSTSAPKGVCVTHANLLHNSAVIRSAFAHDAQTRIVSWLPLYHDMGLIGGMLQPLYLGVPCVLMAPVDFMQRPLRWLETIGQPTGPHLMGGWCTGGRIAQTMARQLEAAGETVAMLALFDAAAVPRGAAGRRSAGRRRLARHDVAGFRSGRSDGGTCAAR